VRKGLEKKQKREVGEKIIREDREKRQKRGGPEKNSKRVRKIETM
jgi:hypothetical protein